MEMRKRNKIKIKIKIKKDKIEILDATGSRGTSGRTEAALTACRPQPPAPRLGA
jgi:hypothetical protein